LPTFSQFALPNMKPFPFWYSHHFGPFSLLFPLLSFHGMFRICSDGHRLETSTLITSTDRAEVHWMSVPYGDIHHLDRSGLAVTYPILTSHCIPPIDSPLLNPDRHPRRERARSCYFKKNDCAWKDSIVGQKVRLLK
jgi:hypothetical protein